MVNPPNKITFLSLIKRGFKLESVVNPFSKSPEADRHEAGREVAIQTRTLFKRRASSGDYRFT